MNNENENNNVVMPNETPVEPTLTEIPPITTEQPVQEPVVPTEPVVEQPVVEPTPVVPTVEQAPVVETPVETPIVEQQPAETPVQAAPAYEVPMETPVQETTDSDTTEPVSEPVKEEKKKKSPIGIIIIILAILMVLGLGGYVAYDHFFNKTEEPAPKEEKITVTKAEAEEYLEYVPFPPEYDLDEKGNTSDDYGPNAYSGKDITTNQMNEELLLSMAYNKIRVKAQTPEKVKAESCGDAGTCYGDSYATVENMNKQLRKMYDLNNVVVQKFEQKSGIVEKTGNYWAEFLGKGNTATLEKIGEMQSYKLDDNNNLIITEKAAFAITDKIDADAGELYKYSNKSELITTGQDPEAMYKENEAKLATFIHTFKLDENNNFYYYSTKVQ